MFLPKCLALFINESILIGNNIGMIDRSKQSYFVQTVESIFWLQIGDLNLFESVNLLIYISFHLLNSAKSSLPYFL